MAEDQDDIYLDKLDDREWGNAWRQYAASHGNLQNVPTKTHLRQFLATVNINLTEKSCDTLMVICRQKGQIPYVHPTTLKAVINEALDSYKGLPVDQAIGGAIVEFNASASGRKHRNQQSMASMQAIVTASTQSLSRYALSKVKETKEQRQKRKQEEKLKRQLKREKLYAKEHGIELPKKKDKKKDEEKKKKKEVSTAGPFEHDTKRNRYARYFAQMAEEEKNKDDDDEDDDDEDASSVIINPTPNEPNDGDGDFPNTKPVTKSDANTNRGSLNKRSSIGTPTSGRSRFGSIDMAFRRSSKKGTGLATQLAKLDGDDEKKGGDILVNGRVPQEVVEILKRQETMLFRIQTQMTALDRQIKGLDHATDDDVNSEMRECIHELQYLKTSSLAELNNELNMLKMELFDGFESISINSAFNVSQDIKRDIHSMNQVIDRTVRLWGNDWNVRKRVISNQQKLDHVLFKAEKILRKYQEMQSNLKAMKLKTNKNIKMDVPQFIAEMDTIRTSLKSMDNYLNTFVFDRLSRMEDALIRIFRQSTNLQNPESANNLNNSTIKRFSVDELMNQLDSQRLNFEGQLKKKSEKINNQKEEIQSMRDTLDKERQRINKETEQFTNLKAKYEQQQSINKQLQFDLKNMKSQLERFSMFNNQFTSNGDAISNSNVTKMGVDAEDDAKKSAEVHNKLGRSDTVRIHPDISLKDDADELNPNVNSTLEFDKFYTNSLSSLIGDFISKSKLDNKQKANEYHKSKERGHLMFRRDEVPKFLANRGNRDAQQQELEERLGFGYEELYYLYRENTEINVRCNRLEHENEALRARLKEIEPVIIVQNVQNVNIEVQNRLNKLYTKLREVENQSKEMESQKKIIQDQMRFVDKYRIEMLHDARKVAQETQAQMNYDKFQFQRQRKKMNALMKSEKEGVLKEREIMESERQEIEELKTEWKNKLQELEKKEAEFDERVELAKTNMNEVVFQKGLKEHLKEYRDDLMEELLEQVQKEAIKDETDNVRSEYEEQVMKQREYYNKRYEIATDKHEESLKEIDSLKLQINHLKQQIEKQKDDILLRDEHCEKINGRYDILEQRYLTLKEEYKILEKSKSDPENIEAASKKLVKKKKIEKSGGVLPWLEEDSDDDDITKAEKSSIKKWLIQRHGDFDKSPNHNNHWLILPEDKLAGKDKDIEDLNVTIRTLKQELDSKNRAIGTYKSQIDNLKKKIQNNQQDSLLAQLDKNNKSNITKFEDDMDTVKKWLKIWQDGIKTVTKAQDRWTTKHSELIKREKELQKEKEDLIYDQRMWYAHKNHILRRFFYFTKQVWWERFVGHEFQKSRADQEMSLKFQGIPRPSHHTEGPIWNQYLKMMLEAWFETGVYQHSLTRWFCQYTTYSKEKDLFHYADNDNNEELYVFKDDIKEKIQPHLESIVERYYKQKWLKRRMKFGRAFIVSEKPINTTDKQYDAFKECVKDVWWVLHEKEPIYHELDIKDVIQRSENEMDLKIREFTRQQWEKVKMTDNVGVVPPAEQQKIREIRMKSHSQQRRQKSPRKSRRKSKKHSTRDSMLPAIKVDSVDNEHVDLISTPSGTKQRHKKKVRIASQKSVVIEDGDGDKDKDKDKDKEKEDEWDDAKDDEKIGDIKPRKTEEQIRKETMAKRGTMRTPKAGAQKTWSHANDNFKSVNKKQKKKLTAEEKKQLIQKRKQSRHAPQKSNGNALESKPTKRSSMKDPISNLTGNGKKRSSVKIMQPDTGTQKD